jgi:hypothetical protein
MFVFIFCSTFDVRIHLLFDVRIHLLRAAMDEDRTGDCAEYSCAERQFPRKCDVDLRADHHAAAQADKSRVA